MRNAQSLIGEDPFLVYSGDILTDIDLERLVGEHFQRGNDVTLALRETGFSPSIALRDGRVVDIRNRYGVPGRYDFANVSVWNSSIFEKIPANRKISFVPVVAEWIGTAGRIGGVVLNENRWFNVGSRTEYLDVHRTILETGWVPAYPMDEIWPVSVSPLAKVASSARLEGFVSIGPGVEIGEEAVVRDSVIWENAKIASRSRLEACIVRDGRCAEGILRAADI
jgi:NDP-sugar pyrophosphorylase family protein